MAASNQVVLDQLTRDANGNSGGQELFYNSRTGQFEVMTTSAGSANPDVVVAPYNEQGFFAA